MDRDARRFATTQQSFSPLTITCRQGVAASCAAAVGVALAGLNVNFYTGPAEWAPHLLRLHNLSACIACRVPLLSLQQCAGSAFIEETAHRTGRCLVGEVGLTSASPCMHWLSSCARTACVSACESFDSVAALDPGGRPYSLQHPVLVHIPAAPLCNSCDDMATMPESLHVGAA